MRCPIETQENAELLLSYSAGRLDGEKMLAVEAHMASCPACREFHHSQAALWETLDQWDARPVSLDFDRRLYQKIEEHQQAGWWARIFGSARPMFLRPALPLAAAACLLLVAGFIIDTPGSKPAPVSEAPQVREVEQVERTLDDMEMLRQFNLAAPVVEGDASRPM
jgi:anti-sigma factor RsiW